MNNPLQNIPTELEQFQQKNKFEKRKKRLFFIIMLMAIAVIIVTSSLIAQSFFSLQTSYQLHKEDTQKLMNE